MKLPLRALQKTGSCNQSAGFCAEYMNASQPSSDPAPAAAPSDDAPQARDTSDSNTRRTSR